MPYFFLYFKEISCCANCYKGFILIQTITILLVMIYVNELKTILTHFYILVFYKILNCFLIMSWFGWEKNCKLMYKKNELNVSNSY